MAVFLLKTLEGSAYVPAALRRTIFDDVPCPSPFADWIEDLYDRGITGGCQATPPALLPGQSEPAPADGGVPREDVRTAALRRVTRAERFDSATASASASDLMPEDS